MDYTKELEFAKKVAIEAGEVMKKYYRGDQHVEEKADHTPVTIADKEVNQLVIDRVRAEFPDHGLLGEESSWHSGHKKLWVCDPIDGTPAFIYHIPTSMFSLALVIDGVPQVAITFNAWTGDLYSAIKGEGALRNGKPLKVSSRGWGKGARIAVSSDSSLVDGVIPRSVLAKLGIKMVVGYGTVFKGCLVAEGSVDGRIFRYKGAHDIAAIKLIIEEAGGKVTDLDGNEQRYDGPINGAILSNGLIHNELLDLVKANK